MGVWTTALTLLHLSAYMFLHKIGFVLFLSASWSLVSASLSQNAARAEGATVSLTSLLVESLDSPLGIDVAPRFSWNIVSDQKGVLQQSYQLRVSSASAGGSDAWDSGVVNSGQPYGIEYRGSALQSDTLYYWSVTVATNVGSATASSTFATGFLSQSNWSPSVWISKAIAPPPSSDLTIQKATWIWSASGNSLPAGDRPFRKTFSTPSGKSAISADVVITVDNGYTLYVNGVATGTSPNALDNWQSAQRYNAPLQSTSNVFAIKATNLADRNNGGNSPAGVLVAIQINYADGSSDKLYSDTTWRTLDSAPPSGFENPAFNDASWVSASSLGAYGGAPWNDQVKVPSTQGGPTPSLTGSNWIWTSEMSSDSSLAPAGDRPFRRVISPSGKDAVSANVLITCDDSFQLFVNGKLVGSSTTQLDSWKSIQHFNVTLVPGPNVFAVKATNLVDRTNSGNSPAGLVIAMIITYSDGSTDSLVSDASWRTLTSTPNGFEQPSFDDSSWANASSLTTYGSGPWGNSARISEPLGEHPAPLLRKEFSLSKTVSWARLYYSAGGYAHITLNGQPISDRVLTPGFTKYDTEVQSITVDVKSKLTQGNNAIGAELGRSHYSITQADEWGWDQAPWRAEPNLRLVLSIGYTDGTTSRVVSDASWRFLEGPTRLDDVYGGENFDARYRVDGFDKPGFNDAAWHSVKVVSGPAGSIVNQLQPPTRIVQSLTPVSITQPAPGIYVAAFERNVVGWAQISAKGPAGTMITIHFGEKLKDDKTVVYQDDMHYMANNFQTDRFWLAGMGSKETFEPKFSYKGYQYIQLEGWPSGSSPQVSDIVGRVVHDDLAQRGGFECSNDLLNKLHKASVYTMLNNAHSYIEDCPTYEKNGWSGDAMVSAEGFLTNFDSAGLFAQYVRDAHESRPNGSGPPSVIAPTGGWGTNDHSPTWHSAFILIPEWLYQYRGDLRVISTYYDSMKNYVEFELGRSPNNIASTNLGDWDTPETNPNGGNPPDDARVEGTAFLYKMLTTMQEIATILGKTSDASTFSSQAAAVKTAFNNAFYNHNNGYYAASGEAGYRQTHNLLALAFGLADNGTQQTVADSIARNVTGLGMHLNTGALGTKHLLPVLTQWGHADIAWGLITQTTYPSWGFWIANGATTMWEHWLKVARSRNHHFLGTFEDWMYKFVLGIQATSPAFKSVTIAPAMTSHLSSASGYILTPYGNITTSFTSGSSGSGLTINVGIPVGVTATVVLPANSATTIKESGAALSESKGVKVLSEGSTVQVEVGSGSYSFRV